MKKSKILHCFFSLYGIDIRNEANIEHILHNEARPTDSKMPVLYTIKCVYLELPYFTIEVQCINETEMYLKALIHDIGMKMKSTAHCISVQCIRIGQFGIEHTLLSKHWRLQHLLENLVKCTKIYKECSRIDDNNHVNK